jgi:hypothetical protein
MSVVTGYVKLNDVGDKIFYVLPSTVCSLVNADIDETCDHHEGSYCS